MNLSNCDKIDFHFGYITSKKYNTYDKLIQKLTELAQYTNDPSEAVKQWLDDNISVVKQYLTSSKSDEDLKREIRYSIAQEAGENEPSPAPAEAALNDEDKEQKPREEVINLEQIQFDTFGGSRLLEVLHNHLFEQDVTIHMLYYMYSQSSAMVYTAEDLNTSIQQYKTEQYKIIRNFLVNTIPGFKEELEQLESTDLYLKKGDLNEPYVNLLLSRMESYRKDNLEQLENLMNADWIALVEDKLNDKNPKPIQAIYAYLNVKYFDALLLKHFNKLIYINPYYEGDEVGKTELVKNEYKQILKYAVGKDRDTAVKSWNIGEFRDALKEMSNLTKKIISTLVLRDAMHKEHEIRRTKIEIAEVATSWNQFKLNILQYNLNNPLLQNLKNLIYKVSDNPNENLPKVLKALFDGIQNNSTNYQALISAGVSSMTLNVLYSIYTQLLSDNTNSLLRNETVSITGRDVFNENKERIRFKGSPIPQLLRQDIIINAMISMAPANYLKTTATSKELTTDYIPKSNSVIKNKFDYIGQVDADMLESTLAQRKYIQNKYNIRLSKDSTGKIDESTITVEINGQDYKVQAVNSKENKASLLTKLQGIRITKVLNEERIQGIISTLREINQDIDVTVGSFDTNLSQIRQVFENYKNTQQLKEDQLNEINNILDDISDFANSSSNLFTTKALGKRSIKEILNEGNDPKRITQKAFYTFMQEMLDLDLVNQEGLETLELMLKQNSGLTLKPLLLSAFKIAACNTFTAEYEETAPEQDFLSFCQQHIGDWAGVFKIGTYFQNNNGVYGFKALDSNGDWIEKFFQARAIIDGTATQSTTPNAKGNRVANYRKSSLATSYFEEFKVLKDNKNSAAHHTLFVQNPTLIKSEGFDSQSETFNAEDVQNYSVSELLLNGIKHNFFNRYLKHGTFFIQPTVYSDKTAFVLFEIDANGEIEVPTEEGVYKKRLIDLNSKELESAYNHYISEYFKRSFNESVNQFYKLLQYAKKEHLLETDIQLTKNSSDLVANINKILKTLNFQQLSQLILKYNTDLHNLKNNYEGEELTTQLTQAGFENNADIVLAKEASYRIINGQIQLNELNYSYAEFYSDPNILQKRFEREKINFLKELLKNRVSFNVSTDGVYDTKGIIDQLAHNKNFTGGLEYNDFIRQWTTKDKLILGKDANGKNIYNEYQITDSVTLNPMLEKYFYIQNLLAANLKYALIGSEVADPDKTSKINLNKEFSVGSHNTIEFNNWLRNLSPDYLAELQNSTVMELGLEIQKLKHQRSLHISEIENIQKLKADKGEWEAEFLNVNRDEDFTQEQLDLIYNELITRNDYPWTNLDEAALKMLENKYFDVMNKIIASCEGAQYKRNVIVPATKAPLNLNAINGVGLTTKMAIFEDTKASCYNINGEIARGLDANDGSAERLPFQAILENGSLGDESTGYELAKSIWHCLDPNHGVSLLGKWATFTITNARMKLSESSSEPRRKLFKKMTNIRWNRKYDLCNSCLHKSKTTSLNFRQDILGFISQASDNPELHYEHNNKIYQIVDFKRYNVEDTFYYISEETDGTENVDDLGNKTGSLKTHLCATLFDENSNEVRIRQQDGQSEEEFINEVHKIAIENNYHTCDSLYELHEVMGGINSKTSMNPDEATVSENSNYAVVGFMNNVVTEVNDDYINLNQQHYKQPLKELMIGYAASASSIKRFQANLNPRSSWYDDTNLLYVTLSNRNLGKQQDPDHEADEAEVTEMSQVIASLDAGGETHPLAKQAFKALGKLAAHGMKMQVDALAQTIAVKTNNSDPKIIASKIYDIIGRVFFQTFKTSNEMDLSNTIVDQVKKNFLKVPSAQHLVPDSKDLQDQKELNKQIEKLLPTSDPNIFKNLLSAFASDLSKKSLKRKYRGLGTVMVPGYNVAQLYHFSGSESGKTFDDIIDLAIKETNINRIKDTKKVVDDNTTRFKTPGLGQTLNEIDLIKHDGEYTIDFKDNALNISKKTNLLLAVLDTIPYDSTINLSNASDSDVLLIQELGVQNINGQFKKKLLSNNDRNKVIAEKYLEVEQSKQKYYHDQSWFQPTDVVNVIDPFGKVTTIKLDDISDYYKFKYYFSQEFKERLILAYNNSHLEGETLSDWTKAHWNDYDKIELFRISNEELSDFNKKGKLPEVYKHIDLALQDGLTFQENITIPKNLRPQRTSFTVENGKRYNIFDLKEISDAYFTSYSKEKEQFLLNKFVVEHPNYTVNTELLEGKFQRVIKDLNTGETFTFKNLETLYSEELYELRSEKEFNEAIKTARQKATRNIVDGGQVNIYGVSHTIKAGSIENEAAELMMSNVYRSMFDQGFASLDKIHRDFRPHKVVPTSIADADIVLASHNKSFGVCLHKFNKEVPFIPQAETIEQENGVWKIYKIAKDSHLPEYQIGQLVKLDNYKIAEDGKIFNDKKEDVTDKGNYIILENSVYQKKYFMNMFSTKDSKNHKQRMVSFDIGALQYCGLSEDDYIADTLQKFISSEALSWVQLNGKFNYNNADTVTNILKQVKELNYKQTAFNKTIDSCLNWIENTKKQCEGLQDLFAKGSKIKVGIKNYEQICKDMQRERARMQKQSFYLSQYVISARIPAQSLQSYMQMKVVGYIPVAGNECMVSHFQTWLQGSDYDIDKAYILGYQFNDNGEFESWSPLFDLSSKDSTFASLELPTPEGTKLIPSEKSLLDINSQLQAIYEHDQQISRLIEQRKNQEINTDTIKWNGLTLQASIGEEIISEEDIKANNIDVNNLTDDLVDIYRKKGLVQNEIVIKITDYNNIEYTIPIRVEGNKQWLIDIDTLIQEQIPNSVIDALVINLSKIFPERSGNKKFIKFNSNNQTLIEAYTKLACKNGYELPTNAIDLGVVIKNSQSTIDIEKGLRIKALAKLIQTLDDLAINGEVSIKYDRNLYEYIIDQIQAHENYSISPDRLEAAYKNAVSAKIQQIVSDPKNMSLAYSPITMQDLQDLAAKSPKGELVQGLTSMNPAAMYIMQKQNMDGKKVIGISAIGEKIFMGLSYYYNEGMQSGDTTWQKRMSFFNRTTRIQNRYNGNPEESVRTTKTDNAWFNLFSNEQEIKDRILAVEKIREYVREQNSGASDEVINAKVETILKENENNYTQADLMISQLLSAATDNAKELILSKINAGEKLAKVYIHLLILGYSMNDIYAFMTSDAISLVEDLLESNRFLSSYQQSPKNVVELIKSGKGKIISHEVSNILAFAILKNTDEFKERLANYATINDFEYVIYENTDIVNKRIIDEKLSFLNYDVTKALSNMNIKDELIWNMSLDRFKTLVKELEDPQYNISHQDFESVQDLMSLGLKINNIRNKSKAPTNENFKEEVLADLDEFLKILRAADETSNLGMLLGLAKGVNPIYEEFVMKITSVENAINDRHNKFTFEYNDKTHYGIFVTNSTKESLRNKEKSCLEALAKDSVYNKNEIRQFLVNAIRAGILVQEDPNDEASGYVAHFSFEKFMEDANYQKAAIEFYDAIKSQYNILDVLMRIPQYRQSAEAWYTTLKYMNLASTKSQIVDKARKFLAENGQIITKKGLNKLQTYADELLISHWLRHNDFQFPVVEGQTIYDENQEQVKSKMTTFQSIRTNKDIQSFKIWIEKWLIPAIKHADTKIQIGDIEIPIDPNNVFIKSLKTSVDGTTVIKKLDIYMNALDSNLNIGKKFYNISLGFNALGSNTEGLPMSLKDYFILYNLIVSKNSPGRDRMTALFSNNVNLGDSILNKYFSHVSSIDMYTKTLKDNEIESFLISELGYDTQDAALRTAPIYSSKTPYHNGELYILEREGNNAPTLKRKEGFGKSATYTPVSYNDIFQFLTGKHDVDQRRMKNFLTDGLFYLPGIDNGSSFISLLNPNKLKVSKNKIEDIKNALKHFIQIGKLNVELNCE